MCACNTLRNIQTSWLHIFTPLKHIGKPKPSWHTQTHICEWCKCAREVCIVCMGEGRVFSGRAQYQSKANMHCTIALHCIVPHRTALHRTAPHCTALHCTALHCTALHCATAGVRLPGTEGQVGAVLRRHAVPAAPRG